ncbi:glycoside hydrolase family 3 protein [Bacteroides nordii]|jgi:beta-glucosidase|uniref:glycoside hydrolase family 3 protein n=1 Tax=Bacteroides nordii TaxID=291645 RepID=UPI0026DCBAA8|nr:glycoside hydrolase family 3 protein [Bacteroides nordii]
MKILKLIGCSIPLLVFSLSGQAQNKTELFRDMTAPQHERILDLLNRLTVEEKVSLLVNDAREIPRLNIDKYNHGNEALHGVVRPGEFTVFPQAIGLAATWNPNLIFRVSTAISDEARGRWKELDYGKKQIAGGSDLLTFWSPTVNMARDPRWGRTPETYGEDPFLSGRIGCEFVKGLQGDNPRYLKTVSTPKHFAANNEEHNRSSCNARMSERDLREYYLPAFERCIVDGKAQSIMMAYNAVNDVPCTVNIYLIKKVLRGDWNFNGYIVSDCSAPEWMVTKHKYVKNLEAAATLALKAGLDLECGDRVYTAPLLKAYNEYMVSEAEIDSAAYHILRGRMLLGLFDDPSQNPYNKIEPSVIGCKEHQELALETARQSMVLLKNQKNFLPLNRKKIRSIAVVGISAAHCEFGDYSGNPKNTPVSVLDGIKKYAENANIKVVHAPWVSSGTDFDPISKGFFPNGLKAEYFDNSDLQGTPSVRMEEELLYDPVHRPDRFQPEAPMSIRWTGTLKPVVSGDYTLGLKTDDGCRLFLDGKKLIDSWTERSAQMDQVVVKLEAGKTYDLRVEYFDGGGDCFARLYWKAPVTDQTNRLALFGDAGKVAKECDVTVAVLGINKSIEREGQDRYSLELPIDQQEFIKELYKVNPNTVVVLVAGSSMAINWMDENVPAILNAWYPGEQGGNAVAEVLFGDYNPGGRLPLTYYNSLDELPAFDDYSVKNRTYQYFEGKPLYEFGYGLSYTNFKYKKKSITQSNDTVDITFNLSNVGKYDGDEVAQVYVRYPETGTYMPLKQLKGFSRVHLKKGKSADITISIPKKELRYWDEKTRQFVTPTGEYVFQVGGSSENISIEETIKISTVS